MVPALSAAMTMPSLIFTETMMVTAGFLFRRPAVRRHPPGSLSWSLAPDRRGAGV
jgi:hypothetical protein